MCELFGMSAARSCDVGPLLAEFFSYSDRHPHGWGLALLYPDAVSLEKEPVPACRSDYLKRRLTAPVEVQNCIAHIRLATRGCLEYANTHPFIKRDAGGRPWTLAHNGTIFDSPLLEPYCRTQQGKTDSERILLYLVDRVNAAAAQAGRTLAAAERFAVVDDVVCALAPHNKVNLLIFDGELFYAHTNMAGTLYFRQEQGQTFFATTPLAGLEWRPLPFTILTGWQNGVQRFTGTNHGQEYFPPAQADLQFLISETAVL